MPSDAFLIPLLIRIVGPVWEKIQSHLHIENRRNKLYRELTDIYESVAMVLRNIAATPQMEIGLMTNIGHHTHAPFYKHCKENLDSYTDLVDHKELDKVYGGFLSITTAAVPERLLYARLAVHLFEDGFLSGRLSQALVLKVASIRVKEGLKIVRRGDWKSIVDRSPNDAVPPDY